MTGEVDPATQGLSLPIWERLSAKERLRNERNKEYNQFLREKDNANGKFRLVAIQNMHHDQQKKHQMKQESYIHRQISQRGPPTKKDAYTSMEAYEELLNRKRHEEGRYRRLGNEVEVREGRRHRISDEEPEMTTRPHQRYDDDDEVEPLARPRRLPVEASLNPSYPAFHLDLDPSEDSSPRHRHERGSRQRVPQRLYHPTERSY